MSVVELPFPTIARERALTDLPVAIIGAGPVGLAAAAHVLERGLEVIVLEKDAGPGAAVMDWGHVRLFSPWKFLIDDAAVRMLHGTGWEVPPADALPTGSELVEQYLSPLATVLGTRIRYQAAVTGVTRKGMDRTRSAGRADTPFELRIGAGAESVTVEARAVIDASGTYGSPNGVLANGLSLAESAGVAGNISHALPDVLGTERRRFSGKHTLVVGAGHSAANTLIALASLAEKEPGTTVTWAIRNPNPVRVYGSQDDELTARASLGSVLRGLVATGRIDLQNRFEIQDLRAKDGRVTVIGSRGPGSGNESLDVDNVVAATGFRPDLSILREIRLSLDEVTEAPQALAPLIDPNVHSCGTVEPHGETQLRHPEANFYLAGMKSYGRAPTFLLATGYEQVRSIAASLAGDRVAAEMVQLVLPATGVCSADTGTCCS